MKNLFFIITLLSSVSSFGQCVNLYVKEHIDGDPICRLSAGSTLEICLDTKTINGGACTFYIQSSRMNGDVQTYEFGLDKSTMYFYAPKYGDLVINTKTKKFGFIIDNNTGAYSYYNEAEMQKIKEVEKEDLDVETTPKVISFSNKNNAKFSIAQNVDEIINAYYETIGGKNWDAINGMRMTANVDQGGMTIPVEVVSMRDGRSFTKVTFMGNTMTMAAFDGKTSWTTNFMTMEPEESTADDSENARRMANEFPNGLVKYKDLGYSATLLGSEKIEGTDCHKIKLEKKSMLVEGKEVPNVEYYYMDKESNVPLLIETEISSGEMKGKISQTKFSDYQEVNGVYFPFSTTSGLKDGESQTIQFEKIEVNPTVEDSMFAFPKK